MRKILQIITVLTVVGFISGVALVFVYRYTAPLILENQIKETEDAIFKVFPEGTSFEKSKKIKNVFLVKNKSGKSLGYAFTAEGNGYQGRIKLMAGVKPDLKTLSGIEILESQETPGLGQEITTKKFKDQFRKLFSIPKILSIKGKKPVGTNQIEAITGATISSKAVVGILNNKLEILRNELK